MTGSATRIRLATLGDVAALATFAATTFSDTYDAWNEPENMSVHLAASFGIPQQTEEILNPTYQTLLAEQGGELVGYAQLREQRSPVRIIGERVVELHRFYVATAWHGKGVAAPLMAAVFERALSRGVSHLWLGVWERNPRAIAFYKKQGFRDVGATVFVVGEDPQTDRVLVRDLATGAPA